jgi:hypothetical protein
MKMIGKSGCIELVFRAGVPIQHARPLPAAYVVLRHALKDDENNIKVTEETHSMDALLRVVESLKEDLDAIVEQAKQRFAIDAR